MQIHLRFFTRIFFTIIGVMRVSDPMEVRAFCLPGSPAFEETPIRPISN